jgi:hypothetical protein
MVIRGDTFPYPRRIPFPDNDNAAGPNITDRSVGSSSNSGWGGAHAVDIEIMDSSITTTTSSNNNMKDILEEHEQEHDPIVFRIRVLLPCVLVVVGAMMSHGVVSNVSSLYLCG